MTNHYTTSLRGRVSRLMLGTLLALFTLTVFSSCEDDPYYGGYDDYWYLSGQYENQYSFDDWFTFYPDGTGYFEDDYGGYLEFDYYCWNNVIYFTFYPSYGPSYDLDCQIQTNSPNTITITFPPGNGFGFTTIVYRRIR